MLGLVHLLGENGRWERVPVGHELAKPRRVGRATGKQQDDVFLPVLLMLLLLSFEGYFEQVSIRGSTRDRHRRARAPRDDEKERRRKK